MNFKLHHLAFLAIVIAFALIYGHMFTKNENPDLQKNIVIQEVEVLSAPSKFYRYIKCEGNIFQDVGAPNNASGCITDQQCKDNQPFGVSFEKAPRLKCCAATKTCGEYT